MAVAGEDGASELDDGQEAPEDAADEEDGDEDEDEEGDEDEDEDENEEDLDAANATKKSKSKPGGGTAKVLAGGAASYELPTIRPKPSRPADNAGLRITEQKRLGLAWQDGPRLDVAHLGYVQEDFARRQEAVSQLRERMTLKSRPGYQLRVQQRWDCQSLARLVLRRHFSWLPCVASSLPEAVWDGDILQVHTHLLQRADVNCCDPTTGQLALNIAIQQQHEPIARLLLDRGADVNRQDDVSLLAPLHNAVIMGNKALFRRLLKAGADAHVADREGFTPLHWASVRGYLEVVAQLVELCGADVNQADALGWTPLHIACFKGYPDLVEYLLVERRARSDLEDVHGFSPLMFARVAENLDVVKRLDDYAAQQEAKRLRMKGKNEPKKPKKKRALASPKRLYVTSKN